MVENSILDSRYMLRCYYICSNFEEAKNSHITDFSSFFLATIYIELHFIFICIFVPPFKTIHMNMKRQMKKKQKKEQKIFGDIMNRFCPPQFFFSSFCFGILFFLLFSRIEFVSIWKINYNIDSVLLVISLINR